MVRGSDRKQGSTAAGGEDRDDEEFTSDAHGNKGRREEKGTGKMIGRGMPGQEAREAEKTAEKKR